jgi:hypothetical protein
LCFLCAYAFSYPLNNIILTRLNHFIGSEYQQNLDEKLVLVGSYIPSLTHVIFVWCMRHNGQPITPHVFVFLFYFLDDIILMLVHHFTVCK